ncbi:hypothetical protein [Acuticoccus sediminis]|uniref:hypothetical protein n=1 Tax=Acuticoccus sediminis TaxID=2184697 RepID=UPI001CFE5F3B|nr:hypothetical protein [Acuticoccus sediminis]
MNTPRTIATLGDLIDAGYTMTGWCRHCAKLRDLDLPAIADRLGRDFKPSTYGGRLPLRCVKCGRRDVALTIAPPRR